MTLRLQCAIALREYREHERRYVTLEIPVTRADLDELALSVATLTEDLADHVMLRSEGANARLEMSPTPSLAIADGVVVIALAERELRFLLSFLLVYHRDGAADVDHIDIELPSELDDDAAVNVTVDRVKPAGTPEELRRLLFEDQAHEA
jgi:hypothetical protein